MQQASEGVPNPKAPKSPTCDSSVVIPPADQSLKQHFDDRRSEMNLLNRHGRALPETCTKRDVCLLMRQLDMDFYKRARAGTLTDMDFDTPPEISWLQTAHCMYNKRGKAMKPIMEKARCIANLKKAPVKVGHGRVKMVDSTEYPAGCSIENDKTNRKVTVIMNANQNSTAQAGHFVESQGASHFSRWGKDQYLYQLCEQDRSLSESAAAYFSPYKLKQSMVERAQMSTSCSFGMYAYLYKLKETSSSCAQILTYQGSKRFHSAQDALDQAKKAKMSGKGALAEEIEGYVEEQRQKFVLIDTIANSWCPGIWNEALARPSGTCSVPRVINWENQTAPAKIDGPRYTHIGSQKASLEARAASRKKHGWGATQAGGSYGGSSYKSGGGRMGQVEDDKEGEFFGGSEDQQPADKPSKLALEGDFCESIEDETLASILGGIPTAPPDFFRDAFIPDGTEHPDLKQEQPQWTRHERAAPAPAKRAASVRRHNPNRRQKRMPTMYGR